MAITGRWKGVATLRRRGGSLWQSKEAVEDCSSHCGPEPQRNERRGGSWCSTAGAKLERNSVPRTMVIFLPGWYSLEQGMEILEREGELTAKYLDGRRFTKLAETLVAVCARY